MPPLLPFPPLALAKPPLPSGTPDGSLAQPADVAAAATLKSKVIRGNERRWRLKNLLMACDKLG
jgi:hypothetical protein